MAEPTADPVLSNPPEAVESITPGEEATSSTRRKPAVLPWLLLLAVTAFALGMLANPWFETRVRQHLPPALQGPDPRSDTQDLARLERRIEGLETDVATALRADANVPPPLSGEPGQIEELTSNLAALEKSTSRLEDADAGLSARIGQLSTDFTALANNNSATNRQARDLLLLVVARRFVETGRPLGWVGEALTRQFATRHQSALDSLNAWSAAPQSRVLLMRRLMELTAPSASAPAADDQGSWWDRLSARLSNLVTIRPKASVEEAPASLATAALESGDIALAITHMEATPPSPPRNVWLADARRHAAALAALDTLEERVMDSVSDTPPPSEPVVILNVPPPINSPEAMPPPPGKQ